MGCFFSVVMAAGKVNTGLNIPEISEYQQAENDDSNASSQENNVQGGERHGYGTLSLSVDSGTSSGELSQLHSDHESRFGSLCFVFCVLNSFILR